MSMSDNNTNIRNGYMQYNGTYRQPEDQIEPRTTSMGSLSGNDVRRTHQCYSPLEGSPVFVSQSDSMSQASYLTESSAYSSDTSWNNTSGSENDVMCSLDYQTPMARDMPNIKRYLPAHVTRPNRSSIGSLREMHSECMDEFNTSQGYIAALQSQLVESYKTIERLTSENESLKFKCSTLLNRLTDTEQICGDKNDSDVMRHAAYSHVHENGVHEKLVSQALDKPTSCDTDLTKHGFKQYCEHVSKELSDDTVLEIQEILRVSITNRR